MLHFKLVSVGISLTLIISTLWPGQAFPQSGRGRPRVPAREPLSAPPPPKIPETTTVVKQENSANTSRFVLRNGITVIISEQHALPLASSVVCLRAGYRDEPTVANGIALLLERVILSNARRSREASAAGSARLPGAVLGGTTSFDSTLFDFTTRPQHLKEALAAQAEMVQSPSISQDQLRGEIETLVEELKWLGGAPIISNSSDDPIEMYGSPGSYSLAKLAALSLGEEVSGTRLINSDALRAITREQLAEFHRAHYRPEKLVIAVVGNVPTFNTLVQIQQLYGDFGVTTGKANSGPPVNAEPKVKKPESTSPKATRPPAPQTTAPPKPDEKPAQTLPRGPSLRYGMDRGDYSQSVVTLGYRVPGWDSSDWPAIEVLAALLGLGRGSRLYGSLIDEGIIFGHVNSSYMGFKGTGLLTLQASLNPSLIDKAESTIFKELDRVRRELAGDVEIARAKALLEQRFLVHTSSYLGRAQALVQGEASGGNYRTALDYRDRIRAVRAEDLQRVASKHLTLSNTVVHEYESRQAPARSFDAERFAATVIAWVPSFSKPVEPKQIQPAPNGLPPLLPQGAERSSQEQAAFESVEAIPVKDFSTLNGPRALVREDHSQPVVTVALLFQGGRAIEDQGNSGITELMLRSLLYGTSARSASDITYDLEQLGANVQVITEPDFFGFLMTGLSRNIDRALKLLVTLIEQPGFREEDVTRARLEQAGLIQHTRDLAAERSLELFLQSLLPGHPYSLPARGREEVVSKITSEQLRSWHDRTIKRQLPLAVIVGDTDGSALISGQIVDGFRRRELDRAIQVKVPQAAKQSEKAEARGVPFTTAVIGYPGPKGDGSDLPVFALIEAAVFGSVAQGVNNLSGSSTVNGYGRLKYEGLLVAGTLYVQVLTSPAGESAVRTWLSSELGRIARGDISAAQFAKASTVAVVQSLSRLQSRETRAFEYARALFYGRQPSEVDSLHDRIGKLSAEQVKGVASQYIKPTNAFAGIVRGSQISPDSSPPKEN